MGDEIQELQRKEKTDHRFSLIEIKLPQGSVSGKWWGPKDVRPILCLHGWLDNCGSFDRLAPMLPGHFSFLTIDLPGHGLSSRYPPGMGYSYYDIVILIERIRKHFNWDRVSLMGHSLGSMCNYFYAAVFANNVDLLISLDNFSPNDVFVLQRMRQDMAQLLLHDDCPNQHVGKELPLHSYRELEEKIVKGSQNSVDHANAGFLLARNVARSSKDPSKYYFIYDRRLRGLACPALGVEDQRRIAENISCPVLVLLARDSYMRKKQALAPETFTTLKKDFIVHYGPGNHHFLLTHPEAYAGFISTFLAKYRPTQSKL